MVAVTHYSDSYST